MSRVRSALWVAALFALGAWEASAEDVKIRPAAGDGVVVTNAADTAERLRINDNGDVFLPALTPHPAPNFILCIDTATGRIGTCAQETGGTPGPPGPPGLPGLVWRGAWDNTTSYAMNDTVSDEGSSWVAVASNVGQQPGTSASWNLVAQEGAVGPPGADCEIGNQTSGNTIVQVCASVILECNNPSFPCPVQRFPTCAQQFPDPADTAERAACEATPPEYRLTPTCPVGYIRLSLVNCKRPDSEELHAFPYVDPYDNTQLGCAYRGLVNEGNGFQEIIAVRILCIKEVANPCLLPAAKPPIVR